ncbi:MAG: NYN domain-containing protein, partial [Planctomycetes bacterium]|nr:NYN domain-containing protein [Planctomycetota bacterium]
PVMLDFENLVYGLREVFGDERLAELLNLENLFGLAGEYGPVATARAYADWRWRDINQHQVMLYRAGVDLVHVFGRMNSAGAKNSADVQMATDAIEAIWTLPHVQTFVIVSGDRDFLPVLKTLRRYGKTVVGVAPDGAASSTLAGLCDRFLEWSAMTGLDSGAAEPPPSDSADLAMVKQTIAQLLGARAAEGMKGAVLRPLLRQHHPTFDESRFGFRSLGAFLASMPELVRIQRNEGGGDITLWPADAAAPAPAPAPTAQLLAVRRAGLGDLRFEPDAARRRALLGRLHAAILGATAADGTFTWQKATDRLASAGETLSATALSKYFLVLLKGRCFRMREDDPEPMRTRQLRFAEDARSLAAFVERYETSACWKLQETHPGALDPAAILTVLGLPASDLAHAERIARRLAEQRGTAPPGTAPGAP